jgi:SAM-dependent methyltransferase
MVQPTEIDELIFRTIGSCPMCGSDDTATIRCETNSFAAADDREGDFFAPYEVTVALRRCRECTFAYVDRLPVSSEFYDRLYSKGRYDYEREFNYHGKREIYRELKKKLTGRKSSGRLLDIGAWCGTLVAEMADTYEVVGCELSEPAAAYARSRGLDVRCSSFQTAGLAPESFDIVTIVDVLEHLPEPTLVLEKIRDLLKPGGILYIKVPNVIAQIGKQDLLQRLRVSGEGICTNFVHINHFGHRSLALGLARLGFEVLEQGYTRSEVWDLRPVGSFSEKSKKWTANQVRKLATGASNLVGRVTPFDIGFNIDVIARKLDEPVGNKFKA